MSFFAFCHFETVPRLDDRMSAGLVENGVGRVSVLIVGVGGRGERIRDVGQTACSSANQLSREETQATKRRPQSKRSK
jgi:hypothetical protein